MHDCGPGAQVQGSALIARLEHARRNGASPRRRHRLRSSPTAGSCRSSRIDAKEESASRRGAEFDACRGGLVAAGVLGGRSRHREVDVLLQALAEMSLAGRQSSLVSGEDSAQQIELRSRRRA